MMNEPICGFNVDNKYCEVLWNEHKAAKKLIAEHSAAKVRVLAAYDKLVYDLGFAAPEIIHERLRELRYVFEHAFDGTGPNIEGHVLTADTEYPVRGGIGYIHEQLGENDPEVQ